MKNNLAIVLTATIIPNAIRTEYLDSNKRRDEYLEAIDYYHNFATIYFLENSSYDLLSDKDFFKYENVHIRKFPESNFKNKGKGYQEFEMLDSWLNKEISAPSRWIKISGRYFVTDFDKIFLDCLDEKKQEIIIEQKTPPSKVALTDFFYVTTDYYKRRLIGSYKLSDDANNVFIEHVVRKKIDPSDKFRVFSEMPLITGVSGSSGLPLNMTLRKRIKKIVGRVTFRFNRKYRFI